MSQRIASLKKKQVAPPAPKKPPPPKKIYLYYDPECDFCKELISILVKIPILGNKIKCISVAQWEVDASIDALPTIDDGEIDEETGDPSPLHKLQNAFTWVMHKCYELQGQELLKITTVAAIEKRIKNVFRNLQQQTIGEVRSKNIMMTDDYENPSDMYTTKYAEDDGFGEYDYSGKHKTRELYNKYAAEARKRPRPKGSLEDRMNKRAQERELMLEKYKAKWEKKGIPEPKTLYRRDKLKKYTNISESEIKRMEQERARQLQEIGAKYNNGSLLREPKKRTAVHMGSMVTERDLARYEQDRLRMLDRFQK